MSIIILFILAIILLGLIQIYFSLKSQTTFNYQKAVAGQPLMAYPAQVTHPLQDVYNAYLWLAKNTLAADVVLSKITAGNYIPAYSGNFVYLGHNPETPFFTEREAKVKEFFSFKQPEEAAKTFLKKENIRYIFYGPQEKDEFAWQKPPYSFLKPVYDTYFVSIYKVE